MREARDLYLEHRRLWDLAWRLLGHGARTHTVTSWTGLSEHRVRALVQRYAPRNGRSIKRPRGKAPHSMELLLRSPQKRREAATFAQICFQTGLLNGSAASHNQANLPDVARGEAICQAFEQFDKSCARASLTIDEGILVVCTLTQNTQYQLVLCTTCRSPMLVDQLAHVITRNRSCCAPCARTQQIKCSDQAPLPDELSLGLLPTK
jgi:hypothetical protein